MKKIFATCLLLCNLTISLHAVTAEAGDLLLGFRATDAPGNATNLVINLGKASAFAGLAANTTTVVENRLAVADLVAVYGPNWASRADLSWGIVGTTVTKTVDGAPPRTIWASAPRSAPETLTPPWPRASVNGLQNASNTIGTMYAGAPGSVSVYPKTANSDYASAVNAADDGSWTIQEDRTELISFRRFNPTVRQSAGTFPATSAYDGTGYKVLDLWEIRPGESETPGTLTGSFGLNSAGKLVFSNVPNAFAATVTPPVELGIPTLAYNGTSVTVTLQGAGGGQLPAGNYVLQRSTSLEQGSWQDLQTQAPVSGTLTYSDPAPPQPRAFYRVKTGQ